MSKKKLALVEGQNIPLNPVLVHHLGIYAAYLLQELHYGLQSEHTSGYVDSFGLKWIYNTFKQWAQLLGIRKNPAAEAIRKLLELNLIYEMRPEEKKKSWDQTPHYRINYVALREYMAKIGLKLSIDACSENEGIDPGQNSGSKAQDSKDFNKGFRKGFFKSKQKQTAAAFSAEAGEKDASGTEEQSETDAQRSGEEFTSGQASQTDKPDLPPAAPPELYAELLAIKIKRTAADRLIRDYGLEAVQQQMAWLPYRPKPKKTAAALFVASLKESYDPPEQIQKQEEQQQQAQQKSDIQAKVNEFMAQLVKGVSKLQHPTRGLMEIIGWNDRSLEVLAEGDKTFVPIEYAANWGLA